jgi:hypothetical protein
MTKRGYCLLKKTVSACVGTLLLILAAKPALATPDLQLFIPGGYYDPITETYVTTSPDFTLQALVDDRDVFRGQESVELTLCVSLSSDLYTLDGNGNVVLGNDFNMAINGMQLANADWEYGYSPLAQVTPSSSLAPHGIFPTAYTEITFDISDPGIYDFIITNAPPGVHFDLYAVDEFGNIIAFAPFSKDAGTVVPEPSTLMLLGTGLFLVPIGKYVRRKRSRY